MTFKWQGRTFDTSGMASFETENPAMPVLYVTDRGEVFIVEIERIEGIGVRLAGRDEAVMLGERHGFLDLLPSRDQQANDSQPELIKPHALIVEDDGTGRHALGQLLHRSGYQIASAATIAEAEIKLGQLPRWLILDLQLPDGRGTTLLERVRSQHLPIKVAITTGETNPIVLSEVSLLEPDVIFHKPLDISQVMQWLDAA